MLRLQANWAAIRALAPDRFDAYRKPGDQDELDAVARYAWNIDVSKALHPRLHILEVTFRNQLHNALTSLYGVSWHDRPGLLRTREAAKVGDDFLAVYGKTWRAYRPVIEAFFA